MTKQKLPAALSAGILLALADLTWVERNKKKYQINMDTWHTPVTAFGSSVDDYKEYGDHFGEEMPPLVKCQVCFAGSVMAGTLGVSVDESKTPEAFEELEAGLGNKLMALDSIRNGAIEDAVNEWYDYEVPALKAKSNGILNVELVDYVEVPEYNADRAGWKRAMRKIAAQLAEIGL